MHKKKIFSITILFVFALVLTACADQEEPSPTPPPAPIDVPELSLPPAEGRAVLDYVLETRPYTGWGTWPADQWNDFGQYLISGAPHGNVVRIFVNDMALEAIQAPDFDRTLPPGSMVIKENYPNDDPSSPGELAALTIMYKVEGFNPKANDWYWIKAAGDGSAIDVEGAVTSCIECHSQEGHTDYLLRYAFGQEPAVPRE